MNKTPIKTYNLIFATYLKEHRLDKIRKIIFKRKYNSKDNIEIIRLKDEISNKTLERNSLP